MNRKFLAPDAPGDATETAVKLDRPALRVTAAGTCDERGAAVYLGTSMRSLRRWRQLNQGPAYHRIANRIWYSVIDLDAHLALCRHDPLEM